MEPYLIATAVALFVFFIAYIWTTMVGFKHSAGWGILIFLFSPIMVPTFAFLNWFAAKRSFIFYLISLLFLGGAVYMLVSYPGFTDRAQAVSNAVENGKIKKEEFFIYLVKMDKAIPGTEPKITPLTATLDTNGDGVPDAPAAVDTDGDGVLDAPLMLDTDGDGKPDTAATLDTNGDGIADQAATVDVDGDGIPDVPGPADAAGQELATLTGDGGKAGETAQGNAVKTEGEIKPEGEEIKDSDVIIPADASESKSSGATAAKQDGIKDQAATKDDSKKSDKDEKPVVDYPTKENTKADPLIAPKKKKESDSVNVSVNKAQNFINRYFEITTKKGVRKQHGILKKVSKNELHFERKIYGGTFKFKVNKKQIKQLEMKKKGFKE